MVNFNYDVIVAGGGGAGLTAAYRLGQAGRSVLIVDKETRLGGRTLSGIAGNTYPYNLGTQFFVGDVGPLADLRRELGIEGRFISLSPLGLFMKGKFVETRSDLDMLMKIPISIPAKLSLAFYMKKFHAQAAKLFNPDWIETHSKQMSRLDSQYYSEAIRNIHPEALPFFRLLAGDICANQPEDVSSIGGMVSTIAVGLGECFMADEGNESLQKAMLQRSGATTLTGAEIVSIRTYRDHVELTYVTDGIERTLTAKYIVSALPADVVLRIIPDLHPAKKAALSNVKYGPYVTGIFVTSEEGDARWRRIPAMVSLDTVFGFVVNQSFPFYGEDKVKPGSVLFGLSFTDNAKILIEKDDDEIRQIFKRDILKIFPEMEKNLKEIVVQKWTHGLPGFRPGAFAETPLRSAPHGRIYFAGDYTADINASLKAAISSAEDCAAAILRELG